MSEDHLVSTLCSKQGELEQVAQGYLRFHFEYPSTSEQPVPVFDHSQSKIFFPVYKWNCLYFSVCSLSHLVNQKDLVSVIFSLYPSCLGCTRTSLSPGDMILAVLSRGEGLHLFSWWHTAEDIYGLLCNKGLSLAQVQLVHLVLFFRTAF